jgi:hypothetical protein
VHQKIFSLPKDTKIYPGPAKQKFIEDRWHHRQDRWKPMETPWKPHGKRIKLNDSVIMTYLWYHIDIGNPIIGIYESLVMRIKNRHIIIYWPLGDIDLKPPLNEWRLARYEDDREFSATIEIWLGISSLCCFATHPAVLMMP